MVQDSSFGVICMIAVSIVSHGHGAMVARLMAQLEECPEVGRIILTRNIPEAAACPPDDRVLLIENAAPKGFGANHNAAFLHCSETFFCVLNPDIELRGNPFPGLLDALVGLKGSLAAPLILAPDGSVEDSIRFFPTVWSMGRKLLGGHDGRYAVHAGQAPFAPEWVAGMFQLYRSVDFARLGGFDEAYFLYYEDVDICTRAWRMGMRVIACPTASAIHDAQRDSHRSLRHLRWHLASMARYFLRYWGRLPKAF